MEQVYLFFVANKNIKDAKNIDPFRNKTFVFFAPLCETLKNKRDSYEKFCSRELLKTETNHETHESSRKIQLQSIIYNKKVATKILSCFFVVKKEFLEVASK
jgi:hypothetical protein